MKQAVIVIAPQFFRDEELFETQTALNEQKIHTLIASTHKGTCHGKLGAKVESDLTLGDINAESFEAIVFIGGDGADEYFFNAEALDLANEFYHAHKIVGAICIAPRILAEAGILSGKRATAFSTQEEPLKRLGAIWTGREIEIDDNIITAKGPDVSYEFGLAISEKIEEIDE